jgi:S-methylmethionine-dependent homocysteine/selenocysteine methylase
LQDSADFVKLAINCAKEARKNLNSEKHVLIAGSNPPNQGCYDKELSYSREQIYENHFHHIKFLKENGCDFILAETIG